VIKVNQVKKDKTKYKVSFLFENLEEVSFVVSEDLVVQYRLLRGKEFTDLAYKTFVKDQQMDEFYQKALRFALQKQRSTHEVKEYLLKLDSQTLFVESIILKLDKLTLLNDEKYVTSILEIYFYQKRVGPLKLEELFKQKGIEPTLYKDALFSIQEKDIILNLELLFSKKLPTMKLQSIRKAMMQMKQFLYQKGYSLEVVSSFLLKHQSDFLSVIDEEKLLLLEMQKQQKKYSALELSTFETKQKIIASFIRKGFQYQDIKKILERG